MASFTRTDQQARVSLPPSFANATVIIEQVSETELRIRKAQVVPEDEIRFAEEVAFPLSDRDRDLFLALLDNPPSANEALKKAVAKHKKNHGWLSEASGVVRTIPRRMKEQVPRLHLNTISELRPFFRL